MEVLRVKVLIGALVLYLLEECQTSPNSSISSILITSNHSSKGFIQPLLEGKHIFSNYVNPVYEVNDEGFVPRWRSEIPIADPSTSRKPISRPTAQKSLPNSSNALPKVQERKNIKEANKSRYRRSLIRNPKFDAVFDLKRQYESFQQKFFGATDCSKKTWGRRITNKSAALPQVEKPGNRGNVEETKGEFAFKKLQLPKFAMSQFFKPSFIYAGPIESFDKSIVSSSSVDFAVSKTTLADALSALKVPLSRKTFKFHSGNGQDASSSLRETFKLPWNRVQISPWSYQYVLEPSRTDSNSSLSTISKVKDQSFWKTNSQPSLRWTQDTLNSKKNVLNLSLLKSHIGHHFQHSLEASKSDKNNSKVSELIPVKLNVSSEKLSKTQSLNSLRNFLGLSLPRSQVDFTPRTTTNEPTWNIQSVLKPAGNQKISPNSSELNVLKPQNFSSLRLPNSHSQVEQSFKITPTPSRSLLEPSEAHKNYPGFLALILPKVNKLSLFQSKPATSNVAEVSNVTSSPMDAQHIQPNSLKSSTYISKIAHGSPNLSKIARNPEVSNSTLPLLPKSGRSMNFSSSMLPSKYSSGLSLPTSHENFSSGVPHKSRWNLQHVEETLKVPKIYSNATKMNASKFNTSQRTLPTPKESRHHQFAVEHSNIPPVPLNASQLKSKAGTFLEGLSASVSSSQSHNAVKFPKKQEIHSDARKVFASSIETHKNRSEFSGLHVPKASILRLFKSRAEPILSLGNTNKLWSTSEFQPIKPNTTESSTKPPEIVYNSAKALTALPRTPINGPEDPERIIKDILMPQLFEDPPQFVNATLTLRPAASKHLSQSSLSERTLSSSAAPTIRSSTHEQPSSTQKVPLSNLSKALQENIWYTSQFVLGAPENSSKLEHETLNMLIMEPEVSTSSRAPLPSIAKYNSFHSKKEAPATILSHAEPERKEVVVKSDLERGHVETATNSNLAASNLKSTTASLSYKLPSVAKGVKFRDPSTLVQNETLILDQSASALLSPINTIFRRTVPNVRRTHIFARVPELPKTEQKPQRDTTLKPASLVISQVKNRSLASSSESSAAAAQIESRQPQQISVDPIRKQDDNRLGKEPNSTLTHMKHVKRRRIRPSTRTRTQNQNDRPSNPTKRRLFKDGGVVKMRGNLSSERVMSSTKKRGGIRRPSAHFHLVPNTNNVTSSRSNESRLGFTGISESHRSDIPVELEAFPVSSRKSLDGEELSSPGSSEVLQKDGLAVNASSEGVKHKKNLVVTLFKEEKLSQNVPGNEVLAGVEIS